MTEFISTHPTVNKPCTIPIQLSADYDTKKESELIDSITSATGENSICALAIVIINFYRI